ncbi:MAG: TlpA family protein disulfide reductase [Bacteroidota bacterium]|nr:TlpA family protein disulfide reductase [Bacteroidota bacterium]
MQILRIIFLGISFALTSHAWTQALELKPLMKGQLVPNLPLVLHVADSTTSVNLYDLNKKLILFDFWGTYCSSCIAQMAHLQELQEKFGNNVQIILVTTNSKKEVDNLFRRLKGHISEEIINAWQHLPFVVEDSSLLGLFPHDGLPSHVWIDSVKTLRGIAYSNSTTDKNIQAFLDGKKIKLDEMGLAGLDSSNPLSWINGENEFINYIKCYSLFFSRLEHAGGGDGEVTALIDSISNKIIGLSCVNMRITDLYKLTWFHYKNPNIGIPDNKILLEVKNRDKFYIPRKSSEYFDWADSSLFCYALKVLPKNADEIYNSMRQDLDCYFHYTSKIENRRIKCLTLKRISSIDKIMARGIKSKNELIVDSEGTYLKLQNQSMRYLFLQLQSVVNYNYPFTPFFNETNYQNNIDINLSWSENIETISIFELRKHLRKYGLDLVEEYKVLKMLVISDSK